MSARLTGIGAWILFTITALMMIFILAPLIVVVAMSVSDSYFVTFPPQGFTLRWYVKILQDRDFLEALQLSGLLAFATTAGSLLLGVPAAIALTRGDFPGQALLKGLVLSPLIFPALVTGLALMQLLAGFGWGDARINLLIGHIVVTSPYVIRSVTTSLLLVDINLEDAARTLGASRLRSFWRITLPQAKQEGLIAKLDPAKIPNLAKVYKRFLFEDSFGVGFNISSAGMFYNPAVTKGLTSYEQLYEPKFRKRILLNTPRNTQSVLMLIVATALATGKPLKEAQYLVDQGWDKLAQLKPNVLTIYDSEAMVLMVPQGQADVGGIDYSKSVYPHAAKGVPIDMAPLKEGFFTGINSMTLAANAPEPELGAAFIDFMLQPSVMQMLSSQTFGAPPIPDIQFASDVARYLPYPASKMDDMGLFTPDWSFIIPRRPAILEKYNTVFSS